MDRDKLKNIMENIMFVADSPIGTDRMVSLFDGEITKDEALDALNDLMVDYESRGLEVAQVAEGWRIQTRPEFAPWVTVFFKMVRGQKLSRASLEALAIVSYRQPITRSEVDEIRGVDSGGVLRGLGDKNLIKTMGRRKSPGNPMMYGTTKRFLEYFGLANLSDLPTMDEFQEKLDALPQHDDHQEKLDLDSSENENMEVREGDEEYVERGAGENGDEMEPDDNEQESDELAPMEEAHEEEENKEKF
ncbi:Segregation and condensation protein B [hydrothermal vent metagenome]|uniref:Segregation and condensation protein B n=1 Tax=hydrothermal vent metagenome TaxID=652676 RepID=A0A3B1BUI9_9ZZZZ